jgi:hypothetical protein
MRVWTTQDWRASDQMILLVGGQLVDAAVVGVGLVAGNAQVERHGDVQSLRVRRQRGRGHGVEEVDEGAAAIVRTMVGSEAIRCAISVDDSVALSEYGKVLRVTDL